MIVLVEEGEEGGGGGGQRTPVDSDAETTPVGAWLGGDGCEAEAGGKVFGDFCGRRGRGGESESSDSEGGESESHDSGSSSNDRIGGSKYSGQVPSFIKPWSKHTTLGEANTSAHARYSRRQNDN